MSFSPSRSTDNAVGKRGNQLIGLALDDASSAQLLEMARRHCKLALEHGRAHKPTDRRREIIWEIQSLRLMREALIDELSKSANN